MNISGTNFEGWYFVWYDERCSVDSQLSVENSSRLIIDMSYLIS